MKKTKRKIALTVALSFCMVLTIGLNVAFASKPYTKTTSSSGQSFSKNWSATPLNTSYRTWKIGFNTEWIDEDYCYTYHWDNEHSAKVKNTQNVGTDTADAGEYAKEEITHYGGGNVIYYYIVK